MLQLGCPAALEGVDLSTCHHCHYPYHYYTIITDTTITTTTTDCDYDYDHYDDYHYDGDYY